MLTKVRNRLAQEEGFTLIELLVVVLIIGILAAVAIPTFLSQKNKAYSSNAKSDVKNAQTIVEASASGNGGNYSTTAGTLNVALPNDSDATALTDVTYVPGSSTTDDSYVLWAQPKAPANTYYVLAVNNGQSCYSTLAAVPTLATAPGGSTVACGTTASAGSPDETVGWS